MTCHCKGYRNLSTNFLLSPNNVLVPPRCLCPLRGHTGCFHFPASLAVRLGPGYRVPDNAVWVTVTGAGLETHPCHPPAISPAAAATQKPCVAGGVAGGVAGAWKQPPSSVSAWERGKSIRSASDYSLSADQTAVCSCPQPGDALRNKHR